LAPLSGGGEDMENKHFLQRAETVLLIAIGGIVGANARYAVSLVLPGISGTFAANVTGSLVQGFILYEATHTGLLADETRLVLATGFLSSYTTYSTFALQTVQANPFLGLSNVVANYAVGFVAAYTGSRLGALLEEEQRW
jgi:CrcB protein